MRWKPDDRIICTSLEDPLATVFPALPAVHEMMRLFVFKDPGHQIGVVACERLPLLDRVPGSIFGVREFEIARELHLKSIFVVIKNNESIGIVTNLSLVGTMWIAVIVAIVISIPIGDVFSNGARKCLLQVKGKVPVRIRITA